MKLAPLKKIREPGRLVAWDIEAQPAYEGEVINTKWLGGGVTDDGANVFVTRDEDAFFKELFSPKYAGTWLYAHNGSGYDFHFLLRWLSHTKIQWSGYRTGGRIFIKAENRLFLDSMCVLRGSLDKVSQDLGTETRKWKVPDDFYPHITSYDWKSYLADDTRALWQSLFLMRGAMSKLGGVLKPTLASTALALWRHRYLDTVIETPDPWDPVVLPQRIAYIGGRCEPILHEMGRGRSFDINSSYPASMVDGPLPCELEDIVQGPVDSVYTICDATVDIPEDRYPVLPHVGRDKRLWWVTGRRRGWYTGVELQECRDTYGNGSVVVHESQVFRPRTLFDEFVHDLYQVKKRAGKGALYMASKYTMNGLYGKYGQRRDREKIVCSSDYDDWPIFHPWEAKRLLKLGIQPRKRIIDADNHVYAIPDIDTTSSHIIPVVSGTIAAKSRLRLLRGLRAVDERACYCDTDSLYVSGDEPVTGLDIGCDLGQWGLENEIISGVFAAPKLYWYRTPTGTTAKAKGLRKRDIKSVQAFIRGEAVQIERVLGVFEARNRTGEWGAISETQSKHLHEIEPRRREDGSCYSIEDLEKLGVIHGERDTNLED